MLDRVFTWGVAIIGFAIMAVVAVAVIKGALDDPWPSTEEREELEEKYGHWAVSTALAVVPRGDTEKLEREAKRLYESRLMREF